MGAGCDKVERARTAVPQFDASMSPAQRDAEVLGRELFDLVDRILGYKSSHQRRLPASLRQAGIDSLTPTMVRRFRRVGQRPVVEITFRRQEGHQVARCEGTPDVLEDALLRGGGYTVDCTMVGGGTRSFTVNEPKARVE